MAHEVRVRRLGRLAGAVALVAMGWLAPSRPATAATTPVAPADGEVVDRFRPPVGPYAAGNRGWEYRTSVGAAVRAPIDGSIVFAGPVAGSFAVVERASDGRLVTCSWLRSVSVVVGDLVEEGRRIGEADGRIFLSVRVDGGYVDPAVLFGVPHLVPPLHAEGTAQGIDGADGAATERGTTGRVDPAALGLLSERAVGAADWSGAVGPPSVHGPIGGPRAATAAAEGLGQGPSVADGPPPALALLVAAATGSGASVVAWRRTSPLRRSTGARRGQESA